MDARARTLLRTRLCDLGLVLERSRFAPALREVREELAAAGLALRPRFYLSTEYGCVVRTVNIGLLFTDGFPATRRLARAAGMRVRSDAQILRTLRHEAGHAFCYGYRLFATAEFRALFGVKGDFYRTYPDAWRPAARARSRVARGEIIQIYADRHADEDFAIAFQTWLADPAGCTRPYRRRPRIVEKLAYVAEAAARFGAVPVARRDDTLDLDVAVLRVTLGRWIERARREGSYNLFPKGPVA